MRATQYTIRNIPDSVDRYLRKKAHISGKSLNQVIIDELAEHVSPPAASLKNNLSWFIGSGLDNATLTALQEDDQAQKALATQELREP